MRSAASSRDTGVLLMAHGTPSSLDEMPEYLRLVRGGRPPSPELVAEMRHNYEAIGGRSPLTDLTFAQADALRHASRDCRPGGRRHAELEAVHRRRDRRSGRRGRRLASSASRWRHSSRRSACRSTSMPHAAALPAGVRFEPVPSFHAHPLLLDAFAERLRDAPPRARRRGRVHGAQPAAARDQGGRPLRERGGGHGPRRRRTGCVSRAIDVAYQSAGRTPEPWIGLDLTDLVRHRAARGADASWSCRSGSSATTRKSCSTSTSRRRRRDARCGATLRRTESLNTSPTFIALLEDLVRAHL